jgi:predicted ATPase with chaperone activity
MALVRVEYWWWGRTASMPHRTGAGKVGRLSGSDPTHVHPQHLWPPGDCTAFITMRPPRASHHTISDVEFIGWGRLPMPREVSLGHYDMLFLDELRECTCHVLEALRQPLEDGMVRSARSSVSVRFPPRLTLVGAQNPFPKGRARQGNVMYTSW